MIKNKKFLYVIKHVIVKLIRINIKNMNKIIVCDIDGTIADLSHRLHYIQGENKKWESFFNEVDKDEPIENVIKIVRDLMCLYDEEGDCYGHNNPFYKFVFLTGRNEICRNKTIDWLDENFEYYYDLFMRKQNDYRPDTEVKPELLEQYLKDNPDNEVAFILDDRDSMVKKWRELGYTCLQVADGDF